MIGVRCFRPSPQLSRDLQWISRSKCERNWYPFLGRASGGLEEHL